MVRAGQRCQVKLSRPHIEVSPPPRRQASFKCAFHLGFGLVDQHLPLGRFRQSDALVRLTDREVDAAAFEQVYGAFQGFHAYFAPLFGRRETRDHSRHYLQALLVQSGERHNAEDLSETVPASARVMQRFLAESPWDYGPAGLTVAGRLELRRFQPQFQHSRRALCPLLFVLLAA